MAGRPSVDLEPYKDELEDSFLAGATFQDLKNELFEDYGIAVTYRTIQRRFQIWNIKKRNRPVDSLEIRECIEFHIFDIGLSDEDVLEILHGEGYECGRRTLQRIRKRIGIYRRTTNILDTSRRLGRVATILAEELTADTRIDNFGRGHFHVWIRRQGLMITRFIYHFSTLSSYANNVVEIALILCIKL